MSIVLFVPTMDVTGSFSQHSYNYLALCSKKEIHKHYLEPLEYEEIVRKFSFGWTIPSRPIAFL